MNAGAPETLRNDRLLGCPPDGAIRIARYSVYPRVASEHAVQTAFTRYATGGELRLIAASGEAIGELLRIRIQGLGEREAHETLARVVKCERRGAGRFELSLEPLDAHQPRLVRHARA